MTDPVIRLQALDKRFGAVHALRDLSVDIPAGPVGLLGPNGAGKTTLIKLLLGLLEPSGGAASVAGFDPFRRADRLRVRQVVGYMPEGDCLLPGMSAVELVATLGRITGLSRRDAMTRAHEVLDYVELEEARYRPLEEYSTGMKQRLKLAQALVHDPPLLLLDEPTNGLDPKGRRHMLTLIEDLGHTQEKNLLLCSHLLPDVEKTCEHVVVLHRGTAVEQGSIKDMTRGDGLLLRVEVEGDVERFRAALAQDGYQVESVRGHQLTIVLDRAADDADVLFEHALRTEVSIVALDELRSTLEDVFMKAIGEPLDIARSAEIVR